MDEKTINENNEEQLEASDELKQNQDDAQDESIEENTNEKLIDLEEKIKQLEEEKENLQQKLLRSQADFENFKRRAQKERENDLKYKSQDLATEIIPVLDNFERALQFNIDDEKMKSFIDGVKMVHQQLLTALNQVGVEEIKAENEMFDPQVHQAVMQVQEEGFESNQIVEVLQKGYVLKDRVIRPSMVKVNE
ncbi:nucleotide exchange factor GrpE [Bacillaceae bacterium W0354]